MSLLDQLRARFDLASDQSSPEVIDLAIRSGVAFRGTNLWLLLFAIVIASVGLNVNSTAVIIGAMLISPLMSPILGVGYGAAITDFSLVRHALANLLLATFFSLVASTAYFLVTPLSAAHSELLARTAPTLWDVIIALFGGLAGIVGVTRREKTNVLPGVAIATALMPPLCTAGFGLATGSISYFAGAFYLFFINSVFIAAATFLMVRLLRLPEVAHGGVAAAKRARRWIAAIVIGTALPSIYFAERMVAVEVFNSKAEAFLSAAFPSGGDALVVGREVDPVQRHLAVTVLGAEVTADRQAALAALLPAYGLTEATLSIAQNQREQIDVDALRAGLVGDLYQRSLADLQGKDARIEALEGALEAAEEGRELAAALETEVAIQVPDTARVVVTTAARGGGKVITVVLERAAPIDAEQSERLRAWLEARSGATEAWVFQVPLPAPVAPAAP